MSFDRLREIRSMARKPRFKKERWATEEEMAILIRLAEPYKYVIESGTANGWSAAWFAAAGKKVITFDPYRRPYIWEYYNGIKRLTNKITCVTGKFHEAVLPYMRKEPAMYFIDGDHRYTPTKLDFEAVEACPGIFVFHDTKEEHGVIRFLETLEGRYDLEYHECPRGITVARKHG